MKSCSGASLFLMVLVTEGHSLIHIFVQAMERRYTALAEEQGKVAAEREKLLAENAKLVEVLYELSTGSMYTSSNDSLSRFCPKIRALFSGSSSSKGR